MCYKGIEVDALGALNAVGHIGINMVKPDWDAVTVSAVDPEAVLSVGVRPPAYRKGATACLSARDR